MILKSTKDFLLKVGEGVLSGLSKIPEGIISTGTLVSDAISGGNATGLVEQWFDGLREDLGIDPTGVTGKVTEALVQFGIPGIAAASAVSKLVRVATGAKGLISKPLTTGTSKMELLLLV